MIRQSNISAYASRLVVSLLLLLAPSALQAQRFLQLERDSVPMFRGFAVSVDLVGAAMMHLSDYGQYEGALRLNLHDQYFPIVEVGYGKADHEEDIITGIEYKTSAPYFRVGADVNILKKKHTGNRLFVGLRYAFTSYKVDISRRTFPDPVWQWDTSFGVQGEKCSQHWAEIVFGIDAKIAGPLHLGWSARYKMRVSHDEGTLGNVWYVPGYGTQDSSVLGATFNVIVDI
ncbi:MAG: hypothetical protein IJ588_04310 [Prevotella sp.]|nr:hypothetical protein [Prevotella sp.]